MKKQSLLLFGWLLLATPVALQAQFTYTTNKGGITITGYTGTNSKVVIPDTITDLSVTSIGSQAFFNDPNLTSVSIPNTVTNIGDYAFDYCTSLTNVAIPNTVTSIGEGAFLGTGLTNITLSDNITSIGVQAFSYCPNLVAINVDFANISYTSVDGILFNKSQTALIEYPAGEIATSYTIPNSIIIIGTNAFNGNTNLVNVTIQ